MDNGAKSENAAAVHAMQDDRFSYVSAMKACAYEACDFGAGLAQGEFLCFPSDDSYYVPAFGAKMLAAARGNNWDLVYCNAILRPSSSSPRPQGIYSALTVEPRMDWIDKTFFVVRRSVFPGFRFRTRADWHGSDGFVIEEMVQSGIRHGRVDEFLVVHN